MTENEALELMESLQISKDCELIKTLDFKATVIKALEDLQQYRALGTVEELQTMKENGAFTGAELAQLACMQMKLKRYTEIGTIEEFKGLKEKNTPKKPIYSDFDENEDGKIIPYKATCPICGCEFEFGTWNDEENHHCVCDQKLDWEGGE